MPPKGRPYWAKMKGVIYMSEEKKDYSSTLNLPKTDFQMRGNLPTKEPETLKAVFEKDTSILFYMTDLHMLMEKFMLDML